MIERRNFYRILHIQPDASFAVIRESYRVLMRAHESRSNLREADWDLGLLNIAYKTLQDPQLRATYNRELLKRYPIKTLSQGAFGISAEHAVYQTSEKRPPASEPTQLLSNTPSSARCAKRHNFSDLSGIETKQAAGRRIARRSQ